MKLGLTVHFLQDNNITKEVAPSIANLIRSSTSIAYLDLGGDNEMRNLLVTF